VRIFCDTGDAGRKSRWHFRQMVQHFQKPFHFLELNAQNCPQPSSIYQVLLQALLDADRLIGRMDRSADSAVPPPQLSPALLSRLEPSDVEAEFAAKGLLIRSLGLFSPMMWDAGAAGEDGNDDDGGQEDPTPSTSLPRVDRDAPSKKALTRLASVWS